MILQQLELILHKHNCAPSPSSCVNANATGLHQYRPCATQSRYVCMRIAQVMRSHNHFAVPSSARNTITLFAQALALRPHRPPSPQDTSCATSSKQVEHNHMCFPVRIALVCATQWLRITIDLCLHTHNGSYIVVGLSLSLRKIYGWASSYSYFCTHAIASHQHRPGHA